MKKTILTFTFLLLTIVCCFSQHSFKYHYPNFDSTYIKPADLIVEATVSNISYFQDTSIKFIDFKIARDNNGVWFIKYDLIIHKIFKGNCKKTIQLILPLFGGGVKILNGKKIELKGGFGLRYPYKNLELGNTGIFILNVNQSKDTGYLPDTYKYKNISENSLVACHIGNYGNIIENTAYYFDEDSIYIFDKIEDIYHFLEKTTQKKYEDVTKKEFSLINNYKQLLEYKNKYFTDSLYSNFFNKQLGSGIINQLNKDSFIYNRQINNYKEYQNRKQKTKQESQQKLDSINFRINKIPVQKKTGMINKTINSIDYSLDGFSFRTSGSDTYLDFDIKFTCNFTAYLAESNIILGYNKNMFGTEVDRNLALVVDRSNTFVSNATNYSTFDISDYREDAVIISVSGSTLSQFLATTTYTLLHISLKVSANATENLTKIGLNDIEMFGSFAPKTIYPSLYSFSATGSSFFAFDALTVPSQLINYIPGNVPIITSISKNMVAGGVGETLDIIGSNFGNVIGKVELPSADQNIPIVAFGQYINFASMVTNWTNNKITIEIPNEINFNNWSPTIGSGAIRVYPANSTLFAISNVLEIKYSIKNEYDPNTNSFIRSGPIANNNSNEILIDIHEDLFNDNSAMKNIIAAMKAWNCNGIKFKIGAIVSTSNIPNSKNIIYYTNSISTGSYMETITDYYHCQNSSSKYRTFHIAILKNQPYEWDFSLNVVSNKHDFYFGILHELGHAIGLAHNVNSATNLEPYDLMYWQEILNNPRIKGIKADDIEGMKNIINYSGGFVFGNCARNVPLPGIPPSYCGQNAKNLNIDQIHLSHKCANLVGTNNPIIQTDISEGIQPYQYFWEPINGNDVTINDLRDEAPIITAINNNPNNANVMYKLTVWDNSDIPLMITYTFQGVLKNGNTYDYSMRDSYEDNLIEPNPQYSSTNHNIWHSPDLWNRNDNDGGTEHQNPEYKGKEDINIPSNYNFIYTRIQNIGCTKPNVEMNLRLYWTIASTGEKWPIDWTTGEIIVKGTPWPAGKEITEGAPLKISALNPGGSTIIGRKWIPPRPQDYIPGLGKDKEFPVCLYARIEESPTYPFGMTFRENIELNTNPIPFVWSKAPLVDHALRENIINNNNIVTRNLIVVNPKLNKRYPILIGKKPQPGGSIGVVIGITPIYPKAPTDPSNPNEPENPEPTYGTIGDVLIYLPDELLLQWIEDGLQGTDIKYNSTDKSIKLLKNNGVIILSNLEADKEYFINLAFPLLNNTTLPNSNYICNVSQADNIDYLNEETSAVDFLINFTDTNNINLAKTANNVQEINEISPVLYPNPAKTILNISYPNASNIRSISVQNELGITIESYQFEQSNHITLAKTIDINELKSGLYFIIINTADKPFVKKFIKE